MDPLSTFLSLTGLVVLVTGGSVYFFRSNTASLNTNVNKATEDLKNDFKSLMQVVESKLDNVYDHIDKKNTELSGNISRMITEIKNHIRELESDNKAINSTLHSLDKAILKMQLDTVQKYASKEEMKDLYNTLDELNKKVNNIQ